MATQNPPLRDAWRERLPALVICAAAITFIAMHYIQAFTMLPDMQHPGNGSPWAPHSDALGPWLVGGLSSLFGVPPPDYLYRPTVGLFWGSILAVTGRIEWIPIVFLLALLTTSVTVAVFASDRPLRGALVLAMAFFAVRFHETWLSLRFDIDLAALAITFTGTLLLLWDRGKASSAAVLAGCACLGVAAAIRGPFMIAGPLVIAIRLFLLERPRRWLVIACAGLFLAPVLVDVGLQRHFGIVNNGLQGLFCVYADPSHGWTPQCKDVYHQRNPAAAEVLRQFIAFRFSAEGGQVLLGSLTWRAFRDLRLFHSPATVAFLLGIAALASGYRGNSGSRIPTPFVKAVFVTATLVAVWQVADESGRTALAWIVLASAAAAATRHWRALLCLAAYLSGIVFLALIGVTTHDRMANTFAFTLVLGIGLLALEERAEVPKPAGSARARTIFASAIGAGLLFLYIGTLVLRGEMREIYLRDVYRRPNVAMKIGDFAAIDRSLYYLSGQQVVYTRHDSLPIGAVRRHKGLATDANGNVSFVAPNAFRE